MEFATWLVAQSKRDDRIGDLASDFKCSMRVKSKPTTGTYKEVKNDLIGMGACSEAYEALREAKREWKQSAKKEG